MKKIIATFIYFLASLQLSQASIDAYPIKISDIQSRLNHNSVEKNNFVQGVSKYIYEEMKSNNTYASAKKRSYHSFSDLELKKEAKNIASFSYLASEVYHINPYIIIAIIKKESEFDSKRISRWKSKKTGNWVIAGTGLTSFVDSGIKEILQQFQIIKNKDNSLEVAEAWKDLYRDYRYKIIEETRSAMPEFSELESKLLEHQRNSKKYLSVKNDFLLKYPAMATMFTAMYLKILLKSVCKNVGTCEENILSYKENPSASLKKKVNRYYYLASQRYNGNSSIHFLDDCKTVPKDHSKSEKSVKQCYAETVIKNYQKIEAFSKHYASRTLEQLDNYGVLNESQELILNNVLFQNQELEGRVVYESFLDVISYENKQSFDTSAALSMCRKGKSIFASPLKNYTQDMGTTLRFDFRVDHLNCKSLMLNRDLLKNWRGVTVSIVYDVIDKVPDAIYISNIENWKSFLSKNRSDCATSVVESKVFALVETLLAVDDSVTEVFGRDYYSWQREECSDAEEEYILDFDPIRFRRESDQRTFSLFYRATLDTHKRLKSLHRIN